MHHHHYEDALAIISALHDILAKDPHMTGEANLSWLCEQALMRGIEDDASRAQRRGEMTLVPFLPASIKHAAS